MHTKCDGLNILENIDVFLSFTFLSVLTTPCLWPDTNMYIYLYCLSEGGVGLRGGDYNLFQKVCKENKGIHIQMLTFKIGLCSKTIVMKEYFYFPLSIPMSCFLYLSGIGKVKYGSFK